MKNKIIGLVLIITLLLIGKTEALILTQKIGNESMQTTVEEYQTVKMIFTSKAGFRFTNWEIEEGTIEGINTTSNEIEFQMPNSNITIRGNYDTEYIITFNGNGGTTAGGETTYTMEIISETTENLISNQFTRTGYRFIGWSVGQDNTIEYQNQENCAPTQNLTLYAIWEVSEVTVQFESNGGEEVSSITVIYGETYGTLPTPTKEGYTLDGWYKEEGLINRVTSETRVTETIIHTLYAKWTINQYKVTINPGGVEYTGDYNTTTQITAPTQAVYIVTYNYNGSGDTNTTATTGFINWSKTGGGNISSTTEKTITYTYGTSDGILTANYSTSVILPTPTRLGYEFLGWSTSKSTTGTSYSGGSSYTPTQNITLYAIWEEKTLAVGDFVSITFNTGSVSIPLDSGGSTEVKTSDITLWYVCETDQDRSSGVTCLTLLGVPSKNYKEVRDSGTTLRSWAQTYRNLFTTDHTWGGTMFGNYKIYSDDLENAGFSHNYYYWTEGYSSSLSRSYLCHYDSSAGVWQTDATSSDRVVNLRCHAVVDVDNEYWVAGSGSGSKTDPIELYVTGVNM